MVDQRSPLTEGQKEALKLQFEWLKHLTTLISAIIVTLITVLQVFFTEYAGPYLTAQLVLCFLLLFTGLAHAMIVMVYISELIAKDVYVEDRLHSFLLYYPGVSAAGALMVFGTYAMTYELSLL